MKKVLSILTICSVLSGCVAFTSNKKESGDIPKVSQKATIKYKVAGSFSCGAYSFNAEGRESSYFSALPSNRFFLVATGNTNYTLALNVYPKNCSISGLSSIISFLTAGIIPVRISEGTIEIRPELTDNQHGVKLEMPAKDIDVSIWSSWFLLPFGSDAGRLAFNTLGEEIFKEAAILAYNKNSDLYTNGYCINDDCRLKRILLADAASTADITFAASNAKSFADFSAVKSKGKADNCAVAIGLISNINNIVSKEEERYWKLVDFYKSFCADYRKNSGDIIGLTKEQLVLRVGTPASAYKVNEDTESLNYKISHLNGDSVEVSQTIYTIDRGIVTNIKYI